MPDGTADNALKASYLFVSILFLFQMLKTQTGNVEDVRFSMDIVKPRLHFVALAVGV